MTSAIKHFLLVFDHEASRLVRLDKFEDDVNAALKAYSECEHVNRDNPHIDIVLVGSDSLQTVQLTHANYFDGSVATAKWHTSEYLLGI